MLHKWQPSLVNRFFLFEYFSPSRFLLFVSTKASRLAWELLRHIPCFPSFALFCDSNFCRSSCFSSFAVAVFLLLKNPGIQQGGGRLGVGFIEAYWVVTHRGPSGTEPHFPHVLRNR